MKRHGNLWQDAIRFEALRLWLKRVPRHAHLGSPAKLEGQA